MSDDAAVHPAPLIPALPPEAEPRLARAPWWYFPTLGAIFAATTLAVLLVGGAVGGAAVILMAVVTTTLELARHRTTGTRATLLGQGPATVSAVIVLILTLATLATGTFVVAEWGLTWVAWPTAAAVFLLVAVGGRAVERQLRRR